jgi:hypothetical protein
MTGGGWPAIDMPLLNATSSTGFWGCLYYWLQTNQLYAEERAFPSVTALAA